MGDIFLNNAGFDIQVEKTLKKRDITVDNGIAVKKNHKIKFHCDFTVSSLPMRVLYLQIKE